MTIGGLLRSLPQPNSFTLVDVLLLVLGSKTGQQGLSYEGINLFSADLSRVATGGGTAGYEAQFALDNGDAAVLLAWLFVVATAVILFNLLADIMYGVLDPRIRVK